MNIKPVSLYITISLLLVISVVSSLLNAKEQQSYIVSYFDHPQQKPFKNVIAKSYQDIGIEVEFKEYPILRGLIELERGNVDANLVRNQDVLKRGTNLIAIEPPLALINWLLVCNTGVRCVDDILSDQSITILDTGINMEELTKHYSAPVKARLYRTNSMEELHAMLASKRLNYALVPVQSGNIPDAYKALTSVNLYSNKVMHFIHSRHAGIADKLSTALSQRLADLYQASSRKE